MSHTKNLESYARACARLGVSEEDATILRRCAQTLHRWAEQECGDGNEYASWAIERDEATGKPYRCVYPHTGKQYRTLIPDREEGALRRIRALCKRLGASFEHQTDPRGWPLTVNLPTGALHPPVRP